MTLLVLTLVAPTAIEVRDAGDLWHALLKLMPNVVTLRKSLRTHCDTREAVRLQATRRTTQYIANARTRIDSPPRIADSMD